MTKRDLRTMHCGASMPKAMNGVDRGFCKRKKNHGGKHGSGTCSDCGTKLILKSAGRGVVLRKSGLCFKCDLNYNRKRYNRKPREFQYVGKKHIFPCGCSGLLSDTSNAFACRTQTGVKSWMCRISSIIGSINKCSKKLKFQGIDSDISHNIIRKMMALPCFYCNGPLNWSDLGANKTPHLDHDHKTGEIRGFAHARCNFHTFKETTDRLKKKLQKLEDILKNKDAIITQLKRFKT